MGHSEPDGPSNRRGPGAAVEFEHVSKHFGPPGTGTNAVVDLSLTVPPGEICVLVGPSGCGKTTSLKMVNRLVEPTSGRVLIDGRDVSTEEPTQLRRHIGYVIQQIGLFPHRTVAQNVATVPLLLGWPGERVRARIDELLTLVGLDPARMRDRYPSQLSGGERQRVGVARALAGEPPVMLMDEPFGAVDPIVREHLQNEFQRIHAALRMTVLFVTHDIDEAIKLGTRVAVMQTGGHLAQYAPPGELLLRPANDFVAQFVGSDRGLKRLALTRTGEIELDQLPVVSVGTPTADARLLAGAGREVLLIDWEQRPLRWVPRARLQDARPLDRDDGRPIEALLSVNSSLRDALSILLTSIDPLAVIVEDDGRLRGGLSLERVREMLRQRSEAEHRTPLAETSSR